MRFRGGYLGQAPVRVVSVSVTGGRPGPVIALPAGAVNLVNGTDVGLLLEVQRGRDFGLELWNPGRAPKSLPYLPSWGAGFGATARLVAYGTGCSSQITAPDASQASAGYQACPVLRILDVVTGSLSSFVTPPGTAGWVPNGFNSVSAISPGDQMIAAYAAVRPQGKGRVRLYVMRLSSTGRARAVPSPAAYLFARTAWSAKGSWLLYQGPGGHLGLSGHQRQDALIQHAMLPVHGDGRGAESLRLTSRQPAALGVVRRSAPPVAANSGLGCAGHCSPVWNSGSPSWPGGVNAGADKTFH